MKIRTLFKSTLLFSLVWFFACVDESSINPVSDHFGNDEQTIDDVYIVTYHSQTISNSRVDLDYEQKLNIVRGESLNMLRNINVASSNLERVFGGVITGFTARIASQEQLEQLSNNPSVKSIEKDRFIILAPPPGKGPGNGGGGDTPAPQETPWGITRVNGGISYTGNGTAWVIDSGIDLDHPDLNVDVNRSMSFLGGKDTDNPDDQHGHGTHVAGTIAAIDNTEGVIGVAAGATVVSVRVLDRRGSGRLSGVIAGVDYVGANGTNGDVANMSLGGGVSTSLDDAVVAASQSGVKFVLAAGNESDDANNHSPARANGSNIYTISAMNSSDVFASFSNYGNPPIDYCAPGVSVYSCWKNGGYNTISGTSMAAPHAAGVLLLGSARTSGSVQGDPDGDADPIISH